MDNSVLWVVALGSGALGLLLLAIASIVAMFWNSGARKARDGSPAGNAPPYAGHIAPPEQSSSSTGAPNAQPATDGNPWAWVKACVFAFFHASIVSVVLGGITFFEDLAKASDEIQTTGTVTFPKQLLPGNLSGPGSQKRLKSSDATGWETADLVNEAGIRSDG